MYISSICSFEDTYNKLQLDYPKLYEAIEQSISQIDSSEFEAYMSGDGFSSSRNIILDWEDTLIGYGWNEARRAGMSERYSGLSLTKNQVTVSFFLGYRSDRLTTVLFSSLPFAKKNDGVEIGVIIYLDNEVIMTKDESRKVRNKGFSYALRYCLDRSPLPIECPFVIIGISPTQVDEVNYHQVTGSTENLVNQVLRSIEFSPQHYQAGVGILSYFNKVLKEKYPDTPAKVKIIQDGLIVKMIIETEEGHKEQIEKALEEYGEVVNGALKPEDYLTNQLQVLELKHELNIAKVRIQMQEDLLLVQKGQIDKLLNTISAGMTQKSYGPITVSPYIYITNNNNQETQVQNDYGEMLYFLTLLQEKIPEGSVLKEDLDSIQEEAELTEDSSEGIKSSSILSKVKNFIDKLNGVNETGEDMLSTLGKSANLVSNIVSKYNSVAQHLGLPSAHLPF